jgi:hypothetical protein
VRCRGFDRVVLTCRNDEELARSREVGATEHRRRDEAFRRSPRPVSF